MLTIDQNIISGEADIDLQQAVAYAVSIDWHTVFFKFLDSHFIKAAADNNFHMIIPFVIQRLP
ncbi:Uncharacterised protein [Mycobacteroides abscessus subsp. abscessus]|nr:Uncharacterised protein [Mycobacteroides abscessus subsp. abscessus]